MASAEHRLGKRREHRSVALPLVGVVLGAATFGFAAAGAWYQFCLDQGEPDVAAAFADVAPPPAVVLLAILALIVAVGVEAETLLTRTRADQSPRQPQAMSDATPSVHPCVPPPVGVLELVANAGSPGATECV
jgi:hypothetical protein